MPTIMVEGPPMDIERKRELVKRLSGAAAEVYGIRHITVLIRENPPENVGLGGKLLADRKKGSSGLSNR
ncbi:MAG: 4-oxalocrotonate tautomerase DmpI [Euryarchaeota archaeon]|nr:4-oxalocrotonate tautomerase DmpI [Euryarchaeota archaeon]